MNGAKSGAVRAIAVVGPSGVGKSALIRGLAAAAADQRGALAPTDGPTYELTISSITFMDDAYALIDTPGAVDFAADADQAIAGADLALIVTDPEISRAALLQPYFHELERLGVPRAVFVNKIDQARAPIADLMAALQEVSAAPLVARQMPIRNGEAHTGFIDLGLEEAFTYRAGAASDRGAIPAELAEAESDAHFHLLEQVADFDDALMEQLLNDDIPSREAVFADLALETARGQIVPVFFGAAAQQFGLHRLLKALRHETPEPDRAAARVGLTGAGAHVVKIVYAGQIGKLAYVRVFGAPLSEADDLILTSGARARTSAVFAPRPGAPKKLKGAAPGEIVALGKLEPVEWGDVLSPAEPARTAAGVQRREAVFHLAIAPIARNDDVRLSGALAKLIDEDPGLFLSRDSESHEVLLHGQGEPHLRDAVERLTRRYGIEVSASTPVTPYRETIAKPATQRGRHKKQTGGHGQFADVVMEFKPLPRGSGFSFSERISGGAVPRQWIPAVEQGVKDALEKGPLGFPVIDIAATLLDGAFHAVDSSEFAFRAAGRLATQEALKVCGQILLEPFDRLTIYTPSHGTARVNSIVSSRNGQILGFEARAGWPGWDRIDVHLPRAGRIDLITELRSATQGLATFTAEFSHMVELAGRRADEALNSARSVA